MVVVFAGALFEPPKTGRVPGILVLGPRNEGRGYRCNCSTVHHSSPRSLRRSIVALAFLGFGTIGALTPSSNCACASLIRALIKGRSASVYLRGSRSNSSARSVLILHPHEREDAVRRPPRFCECGLG